MLARLNLQNKVSPPGTDKKSKLNRGHAPTNPPLTPSCCQCQRQRSQAGHSHRLMQHRTPQLLVHQPRCFGHRKDIWDKKSLVRCRGIICITAKPLHVMYWGSWQDTRQEQGNSAPLPPRPNTTSVTLQNIIPQKGGSDWTHCPGMPLGAVIPRGCASPRLTTVASQHQLFAPKHAARTRSPLPAFPPYLQEGAERGIGGVVGDQEPHVFVADLHRRRAVHAGHGGTEGG